MKKKICLILVILCLSCISVLAGCSASVEYVYDDIYYAVYGEWFTLPDAEQVRVYYANGTETAVEDNRIFIDDISDYSLVFNQGKKEKKSTLKINANKNPAIFTSKEIVYGTVNELVELPQATAFDGVKEWTVTAKLMLGETEINVDNGFIPQTVGNYEYVLKADNGNSGTLEKRVPVYVEESKDAYEHKIVSFDKPYGLNQLALASPAIDYSTERAFPGESGSTRFSLYTDYNKDLVLVNAEQENISDYDAIYFYIYNDSDMKFSYAIGWTQWIELNPRAWTEVFIDVATFDEMIESGGAYASVKNTVSSTNINGLHMACNVTQGYIYLNDCIYLSSIRGMHYQGVTALQAQIQASVARGETTLREASLIEYEYGKLSAEDKALVSAYSAYQPLKIDAIMETNGIEKVEDKILYFNTPSGISQIRQPWQALEYAVTDEKTYQNESVLTTKVPANETTGELAFIIEQPYLYDLSAYDYVRFGIYFEYDKNLTFYNDDNKHKNIGIACQETLYPNQWNEVVLALGDNTTVEDSIFWIIRRGNNDWLSFDKDVTFYISSMYAGAGNPDLSEFSIDFDKEQGAEYLSVYENATIEHTTSVQYGQETGSTKISASPTTNGAQLYLNFENCNVKSFSGQAVFKLYMYYVGERDYSVYFIPKGYYKLNMATKTKLSGEGWTEVLFYLPEGRSISEYGIILMADGWTFETEDSVYLSKLTFAYYASETDLEFDEPYGVNRLEVVQNAQISYTTDKKYADEKGSLKITASADTAGNELYMNVNHSSSSSKTRVYTTYVYNDSQTAYNLYILPKGYYTVSLASVYALTTGEWTKVEFILPATKSLSEYSFMVMTGGWLFNANDAVYMSAFKLTKEVSLDGIAFDKETGKDSLTSLKNAQFAYTSYMHYQDEQGATKISASATSDGKQLYVNMDCFPIVEPADRTFKLYVYYAGETEYTFHVIRTNYWSTSSALSSTVLQKGEWTEITFTVPQGKCLDDYSFMIMDTDEQFALTDCIYLSALKG